MPDVHNSVGPAANNRVIGMQETPMAQAETDKTVSQNHETAPVYAR